MLVLSARFRSRSSAAKSPCRKTTDQRLLIIENVKVDVDWIRGVRRGSRRQMAIRRFSSIVDVQGFTFSLSRHINIRRSIIQHHVFAYWDSTRLDGSIASVRKKVEVSYFWTALERINSVTEVPELDLKARSVCCISTTRIDTA